MSYRRKKEQKVVEVLGQKIVLENISYGKRREIQAETMSFNQITGKVTMIPEKILSTQDALRIAKIKSWDLVDEENAPLPISLETFDEVLDKDFIDALSEAIDEVFPEKLTDEEKK